MDYNSLSLKMHEEHKGKVEVVSKVAVKNRDDLSTAYTPPIIDLAGVVHGLLYDVPDEAHLRPFVIALPDALSNAPIL